MNKSLILTIFFILFAFKSNARDESLVRVTPIIGYERVFKFAPTTHTKDRLVYGIRAVIGPSFFSLESEITQGSDTEDYPEQSLKITEVSQKLKLGLRSGFYLIPQLMRVFLRGGMQARKKKTTRVESSVTTIKNHDIYTNPYLGTGFSFHFMNNLSAQGGITAIITDQPKSGDMEYQTSLGLTIKI